MPRYAIKGSELLRRLQRPHVQLGDSNETWGVANRLFRGRMKDSRRGAWGFIGVPLASGADISTMGYTVSNGPSPATITYTNLGTAPVSPLSDLPNRTGVSSPVGVYTGGPVFSPAWRLYIRNSFFAVDPFTNQNVKFGELRVNCGVNGSQYSVICTGCVSTSTQIYNSSSTAINDSVGTRGGITFYETPTCATGTGSADISMYRQTFNGVPASGNAAFPLFRTVRHATLDKTRYGEICIASGGLGMDHFQSGSAGPADDPNTFFNDDYLDAVLSAAPIEGDYDTGGVSGVINVKLTQNRFVSKAAWKTSAIAVYDRLRASLVRINKHTKDILICFELSWDTTSDINTYNPATEQVRFNEMWEAIQEICSTRTAMHDKCAGLPTGLEIRDRYGSLTNWAFTGPTWLANESNAAIHTTDAGSIAIPAVTVDIILRGDEPSSGNMVRADRTFRINRSGR